MKRPIWLLMLTLIGPVVAEEAVKEDVQFQKAFDQAVDRGLTYLVKTQRADGSWDGHTGLTALGVMAFLARGNTPGLGAYGDTIDRGVDFVLGCQDQKGTLMNPGGGQMYSHNIATLMLSEVSGMVDPTRQQAIDQVLSKAVGVTLAAQKVTKKESQQGGWRYQPGSTDSDMSLSGWAFMALRSAKNSGAPVPREAIDAGMRFIKRCVTGDGGYSYQPGGSATLQLTGAALLCMELSGEHRSPGTLKAGAYIRKHYAGGTGYRYYANYYLAQGMHQLGGQEWETFAPQLYKDILGAQLPNGAWRGLGGKEDGVGANYRTSMAILALSVSYRQLPIYQR